MNTYPTIPPITHPLGKAWEQPSVESIKFSIGCAWVSKKDFNKLLQYDSSNPSGVYEGKMWKRKQGNKFYLMWYGVSDKPECCCINHIELMINP